jgi:4-alpha-glucanotransferase
MRFPRSSGVLLHPSSLAGPYGIGTIGPEAWKFVDFLAKAGVGLWQILPLGPTGYGDSPYQCLSSFAGNPNLIDPGLLAEAGLVSAEDLEEFKAPNTGKVDFGWLFGSRRRFLDKVWERFSRGSSGAWARPGSETAEGRADRGAEEQEGARPGGTHGFDGLDFGSFRDFCADNASWLDDFALFMTIKEERGHESWDRWPEELRLRKPKALAEFSASRQELLDRHKFIQYLFFSQWRTLKAKAEAAGVRMIGDIPIFVARDSADVWAHPELFQLDAQGLPLKVAGVPPDYFTATGQLWGNPLYDWRANQAQGFAWWISRIEAALSLVDILRIDHFRGFSANWAVPALDKTAERGRWEPGPGRALFDAVQKALGELPIIAEDLGFITPEVHELRDRYGFPGMKILQFAFEPDADNPDYPHHYPRNAVVYTGTHDNDTSAGWLSSAPAETAARALAYVGGTRRNFHWNMMRTAWASPAVIAVAPFQDLLGLGSEARMNYPGTQNGWWSWRIAEGVLTPALAKKLKDLSKTFFRLP